MRNGWSATGLLAGVVITTVVVGAALVGCATRTTGPEPSGPPSAAAGTASPLPQVGMAETYVYPDHSTVRVSGVVEAELGPFSEAEDPDAKEGDRYLIITLTWDNRSGKDQQVTPVVTVKVGSTGSTASRVGVDTPDYLPLAAGTKGSYDVGVMVAPADRSQVVIEIVDGLEPSHSVSFRGALTVGR